MTPREKKLRLAEDFIRRAFEELKDIPELAEDKENILCDLNTVGMKVRDIRKSPSKAALATMFGGK
jgi:hypothetical protein